MTAGAPRGRGCRKCPIFAVCPVKSLIGDYRKEDDAPVKATPTARPSRIPKELTDSAWFTERGLNYLRGRAGKPWFLHLGYYRPHPPEADPDPGDYRGHAPDGSGGRVFSGTLPYIQPLPPGTRSNPASSSPTVAPGATPDQRRSGPGTYPTLPWNYFPEPGTTYFPVPGGQR